MYQIPVGNLEKIRRSRKRVKSILSDIGLENCKDLLEDLQEYDAGDKFFHNTDWSDFTEGYNGRRKKKWRYRTQMLCCSLCHFSARSWYSFKSHIQRCHEEERDLGSLVGCSCCPFVGHPKVISRHFRMFHAMSAKPPLPPPAAQQVPAGPASRPSDLFSCRKCGFQDTLLYCVRKHVLLNHYTSLLNRYFGQRTDGEGLHNGPCPSPTRFYCKVCLLSAETSEHLLYHLLSSEKHREVEMHVRALICEPAKIPRKYLPSLAPKAMQIYSNEKPKLTPLQRPEGVGHNASALVCAPGTSQTFLPAQASALVRLASAEAKGLLQPPVGAGPVAMGMTTQQTPMGMQVAVPRGGPAVRPTGPQSVLVTQQVPLTQPAPQGPVLASQSLLSHLIPTGNKVNGLPTYTLAPLQVAMPVQPPPISTPVVGKGPAPSPKLSPEPAPAPAVSKQAKKWITCPVCNELFPSNVYQVHIEVAHKKVAPTKLQGVAARAPFLKKMPDKTVKCLMCKILLSEKGLFDHLLHGLSCLYCSAMFYSVRQLVDHTDTEHSRMQKTNRDFIRQEYRLYTDELGNLLFPYFDINTSAPKELLGDKELNLALVTASLDLIFLKMYPAPSAQPVCRAPVKSITSVCPFCPEKLPSTESYHQHLKAKHYIMPTIHAILKTPAYKCIYCSGVYTGKTTPKAISIHVQRCRCAPKSAKDAERLINPDPAQRGILANPATQAEVQSKLRLEIAVQEAMEANRREREARAAKRRRIDPPPVDLSIPLVLDPSGMEMRSFEERREFLTRYFNLKPYLMRREQEALAARLWFNKSDVACHFATKRTRCLRAIQRQQPGVLLGFNMTELRKLQHNILLPEDQEKPAADKSFAPAP